jgi:hypothetical protein
LGQEACREQRAKKEIQVEEALLLQLAGTLADIGKMGPPVWKEGRLRHASIYTCLRLDVTLKLLPVKKASIAAWKKRYVRLRHSLSSLGYISEGSVLDRTTLKTRRSGYQWTRKAGQKTMTIALSAEQFKAMKKAIDNRRRLARTIKQMESLSRRILFHTLPDTHRNKPLKMRDLR